MASVLKQGKLLHSAHFFQGGKILNFGQNPRVDGDHQVVLPPNFGHLPPMPPTTMYMHSCPHTLTIRLPPTRPCLHPPTLEQSVPTPMVSPPTPVLVSPTLGHFRQHLHSHRQASVQLSPTQEQSLPTPMKPPPTLGQPPTTL